MKTDYKKVDMDVNFYTKSEVDWLFDEKVIYETPTIQDLSTSSKQQQCSLTYKSVASRKPIEVDYTKAKFNLTSIKSPKVVSSLNYRFHKADENGEYTVDSNWGFQVEFPEILQNYVGLPASISVFWKIQTDGDAFTMREGAPTVTFDVSEVLWGSTLNYIKYKFGVNSKVFLVIAKVSGVLKPNLGTVGLNIVYPNHYYRGGSRAKLWSNNEISMNTEVDHMVLTPAVALSFSNDGERASTSSDFELLEME